MKYNYKFNVSKEELAAAYSSDPCSKRVAEKFKVSKNTVLYWLKKHNIPIIQKGGRNVVDLTGQKFGDLTVIEQVANDNGTNAKWLCECSCGRCKAIVKNSLTKGLTNSCGCKKFNLLYRGHKDISGCYWSRIKKGAKQRGLEFSITHEQTWQQFLKQDKRCAITGLPITLVKNLTRDRKQQTASLDRIDNGKGYTVDNIQWTHKEINMMRRNMDMDKFVYYCNLVVNKLKEG